MADIPKIHSVASQDKNRALSAMFMAFTADPLARWFAPEADHYVLGGLGLMEAFGGKAFEAGTAYATAGSKISLTILNCGYKVPLFLSFF